MRAAVCASILNAKANASAALAIVLILVVVAAHHAEANTHFLRPLRSNDVSQPRQARSVEDFQRIVKSDPDLLAAHLLELDDADDDAYEDSASGLDKRDPKSHFLRALRGPQMHFLRPLRASERREHFLRALRSMDDIDGPFQGPEDNAHKRSKAHFLRSL